MSRHAESDPDRLDQLAAEMASIPDGRPDQVGEDQLPLDERPRLLTGLDVSDGFDPAHYPHALDTGEA